MSDLIITGIIDGPLTGGIPKAIEFYALDDISDLSIYGFGSANNGGGTDGQEYTFSGSANAGDYIYIASESPGFSDFFGFEPNDTGSAANINGDDAIELFQNGTVVDVFGDINLDGTGEAWDYQDGWAYRVVETEPDGNTFNLGNWIFSSPNALDGETTNAGAIAPFPLASFEGGSVGAATELFFSEYIEGSSNNKAIEIANFTGDAIDLTGYSLEFYFNGNASPGTTILLDGNVVADEDVFVIADDGADAAILAEADLTSTSSFFNGDDAVILRKNGDIVDAIGQIGFDPGSQWGSGDVSTQNNTIRRQSGVVDGDTEGSDAFDPTQEWDGFASDTFDDLGVHSIDGDGGGGEPPAMVLISEIQGNGAASSLVGNAVTIEAVVVGDFQDGTGSNGDLNGFFVQEQDADADGDLTTSEGLFIFDGNMPAVDVAIGDVVQVSGTVTEFNGLTELTNVTVSVEGTAALPTAATVNFPVTSVDDLESYEGMQISIPDTLFVTEYFNLDRFGEVVLASDGPGNAPATDGRLDQFTQFNAPSVSGFEAHQEALSTRRIVLDDGQTIQNPDPIVLGRGGNPLSMTNTLRGGDTVNDLTGVLSFGFGEYRIQPTTPVDFQATNPRPATPEDVGGNLKVASFNVLNFFTTLDQSGNPGSGPSALAPRGADNQEEFDRQLEKLVTTLETMDADIVGLIEIENEFGGDQNGDGQFAIDTLVTVLNNKVGAGTYAYVDPGQTFVDVSDAISVGAIYKTETVQIAPGTSVEILDDSDLGSLELGFDNAVFNGPSTNRASLAVTFEEIASGEQLTVAVNHFKSKGSVNSAPGNEDIGDGQGNNNQLRLQASMALNAWLASNPTGRNDSDVLIIGDLNAYAQEDPITFLEDQGYENVVEMPESAYSFAFDGQFGTLDYGLASQSLTAQITGATEWHVNADEPDALDYNLDFGRNPNLFDGESPFRNSDHDPLIIGLELGTPGEEIIGTNRRDRLVGSDGDDTIFGLRGKDRIYGGKGNDRIIGGRGKDRMTGGLGQDTFVFTTLSDRHNRIKDFEVNVDSLDMSEIFDMARFGSINPFDDYIRVIDRGSKTWVQVDIFGDARWRDRFRTIAILENVSASDVTSDSFIL